MTRSLNFTNVHSRRKLGRGVDFVLEVAKLAITLALITAGLSLALWSVLGVNPFHELTK